MTTDTQSGDLPGIGPENGFAGGPAEPPLENTAMRETLYPLKFDGKGSEYFRIWIVNVALSVLTLGIYSAWATVRTRRYFYGKTSLDGTPFQFTAKPIPILIGRIIALIIFGTYSLLSGFKPLWAIGFLILVILPLTPWMIVKSQQFRARYTQWRNINFRFTGGYGEAFLTFVILPVAAAFTAWIILPIYWKEAAKFQFRNLHYGATTMAFDGETKGFWATLGFCVLWVIAAIIMGIGIGYAIAKVASNLPDTISPDSFVFALIGLIYLPLILIVFFVQARLFNVSLSGARVGAAKFKPDMPVAGWIWVMVSNIVLLVLTLGIAYPWTAVRAARYKIEHLALVSPEPLDFETFAGTDDIGATGAELAGDFGIEISIF